MWQSSHCFYHDRSRGGARPPSHAWGGGEPPQRRQVPPLGVALRPPAPPKGVAATLGFSIFFLIKKKIMPTKVKLVKLGQICDVPCM
jgi:hypothetical protein